MIMKICTLNKIAACGTDRLAGYTITDEMVGAAGVMVRSAAMHDMDLPDTLLGIARAGAGVNNIPIDKCSKQGICVFNTPGANANAVAELVLCGLLLGFVAYGFSIKMTESESVAQLFKLYEKLTEGKQRNPLGLHKNLWQMLKTFVQYPDRVFQLHLLFHQAENLYHL